MRQLQAECVSEVTVKRVEVARALDDGGRAGGTLPPEKAQLRISGGWAKRLHQDQQMLQKRQKFLQKLQAQGQLPPPKFRPKTKAKTPAKPSAMSTPASKAKAKATARLAPAEPQPGSRQQATRRKDGRKGPMREPARGVWKEAEPSPPWAASVKLSSSGTQAPLRRILEQQMQQQRLQVFLECCLASGQVALAHHMLISHHSRPHKRQLLTLAMYNTVMLGWARKVRAPWGR